MSALGLSGFPIKYVMIGDGSTPVVLMDTSMSLMIKIAPDALWSNLVPMLIVFVMILFGSAEDVDFIHSCRATKCVVVFEADNPKCKIAIEDALDSNDLLPSSTAPSGDSFLLCIFIADPRELFKLALFADITVKLIVACGKGANNISCSIELSFEFGFHDFLKVTLLFSILCGGFDGLVRLDTVKVFLFSFKISTE